MTALEKLYDIVFENNITIINYHFSNTKKAACLNTNHCKAIVLDKPQIESSAEESVLLAEEVGHYETESMYLIEVGYNSPIAKSNRIKYEGRARRWAIENTLPPEKIRHAIDNASNDYEIAESCQVTVDFLRLAFEYYALQGVTFQVIGA